jgi:hypothetical protein
LVFLIEATGALVTDFFTATLFFLTVLDFAHFAGAAEAAGEVSGDAANAGTTVAINIAPARNNDVDLVFMILISSINCKCGLSRPQFDSSFQDVEDLCCVRHSKFPSSDASRNY